MVGGRLAAAALAFGLAVCGAALPAAAPAPEAHDGTAPALPARTIGGPAPALPYSAQDPPAAPSSPPPAPRGPAALRRAPDPTPHPSPPSKKGLQVQMVEDALELGIHHAALNVQLGHLATLEPGPDDPARTAGGEGFHLRADALRALDAQVRPLSEAGVVVHLVLLARATGDARDELVLHGDHDPAAPNRLSAFAVDSARGRAFLEASVGLLAERYRPGSEHGTVWGWIVGNEVNSHWWWSNLGRADLERVADQYERAVRLVHGAVTREVAAARVYLSLEHHWGIRYPAGAPDQALAGRDLLERFAALARERGEFAWHVAFHPYPEDLFDCRTWEDTTAPLTPDAPRVTFRNLEVLTDFLEREELLLDGEPRRVILSEQGFHCRDDEDGERDQAAAYAYAWVRTNALEGVDAFLLHRHVDHAHEGGLRLGLWTRREGSVATPDRRRRIWEVMRACGGPGETAALEFALPVVGVASWDEVLTRPVRAGSAAGRSGE